MDSKENGTLEERLCDLGEYQEKYQNFRYPCGRTRLPGQFIFCKDYQDCKPYSEGNHDKPYEL